MKRKSKQKLSKYAKSRMRIRGKFVSNQYKSIWDKMRTGIAILTLLVPAYLYIAKRVEAFFEPQTVILVNDEFLSPIPLGPTPTITPSPTLTLSPEVNIEKNIRNGLRDYAKKTFGRKIPAEKDSMINLMVEATEDYEFFKRFPYLLPQIMILESSGCVYMTYPRSNPKNCINWGIRNHKWNIATESLTMEEIVQRAIWRIGAGGLYENVRNEEDDKRAISLFASKYEPMNDSYFTNLFYGMLKYEK